MRGSTSGRDGIPAGRDGLAVDGARRPGGVCGDLDATGASGFGAGSDGPGVADTTATAGAGDAVGASTMVRVMNLLPGKVAVVSIPAGVRPSASRCASVITTVNSAKPRHAGRGVAGARFDSGWNSGTGVGVGMEKR